MAEIYVPGAIDIMGSANQMMQFRNSQQAQQANALQMQYAAEDRARAAQERSAAAGNARAELVRKQQFMDTIKGGYMPAKTAVMGPGTVQGNTPASFDPEKVKNELLRRGDLSGLVTFSNAQEQIAKQQEQEAKVTGQGLTNEGIRATNTGTNFKNTADFIKMTNAQIDAAPDIASLRAIVAATFTPDHPMAKFNELNGLTLEQSMEAIDGLIAQGKTFEQIREQMSQGASKAAENIAARGLVAAQTGSAEATTAKTEAETKAADEKRTAPLPTEIDIGGEKIFVDMNPNSPTFKQKLTNFVKTLTPNEVATNTAAAAKADWEQKNPGFTIEDTASGKVKVNKITGVVEPLTLDGQTLMPSVKPGVTVNTGDTAGQTYEKKGAEAIIANYTSLSGVPQQIENYRKVKELIPEAVKFMGKGGEMYADVVSFLNNRIGTNINVNDANGNLASAREIESRLFQGILENLKKLDSQPTQAQQQALKDAIGKLGTEPDALARLVDAFTEPLIAKVKVHNNDVDKALKRGDVRAEDYRIKLPETTDSAPKKFKWNASTGLMEQQ